MDSHSVQRMQTALLSSGNSIPLFGLGTYKSTNKDDFKDLLLSALDLGYRHFDTAIMYSNESLIGEAFEQIFESTKYKRSDIFLVTKFLSQKGVSIESVVEQSLTNLRTDYIDLLLIHYSASPPNDEGIFPHKPVYQVWGEMEELVEKKKLLNIGVSNFNVQLLLDLLSYCKIKPAVNQYEVNIYLQQDRLREFCFKQNIHCTAYCPLARCIETENNEVLIKLAQKYHKTVSQIMINFIQTLGVSVIPKTTKINRLKENIESTEFLIEESDIQILRSLNQNKRVCDPYFRELWQNVPYYD